jgi:hypothetical protein
MNWRENMETSNIDSNLWNRLGLKADPFPLTPTPYSEHVWAGQIRLKNELDELLKQGRVTSSAQFIGIVAPWGSGKTHALGYYSHSDNLPRAELTTIEEVKFLNITFPKSEKQIAEGFFHRVVDKMSWKSLVNNVIEFYQRDPDEFTKDISTLLQDNADLVRAFDFLKDPDLDEATSFIVQSYLFGEASKRDRQKLRFIRPGNSIEERYLALNAFFALETGWRSPTRERLILWIDEAENLIKLSASNFDPFTQGLRDVLDMARKTYGHLTVVINFTPESKNYEGEMYAILGNALYDRLDQKITITPMSGDEAKTFVQQALLGYSLDSKNPAKIFSEDALELLPTLLGDSFTPRKVNRLCGGILAAMLTKPDAVKLFPINRSHITELQNEGRLENALAPDRPGT